MNKAHFSRMSNEHVFCFAPFSLCQFQSRIFDEVKKKRNPLFNPEYMMNALLKGNNSIENIKLHLNIKRHLHHSLDFPIKWFEESVGRLNIGVEIVMTEHARHLPQQHCKILRLADIGILNYVTMATLARASRAICHKFDSAPAEHAIAGLISDNHRVTILRLVKELDEGPYHSFDGYYQKVSKLLVKEKKYFTEHPLSRYF